MPSTSIVENRVRSLQALGGILGGFLSGEKKNRHADGEEPFPSEMIERAIEEAKGKNPWFLPDFIKAALDGVVQMLMDLNAEELLRRYPRLVEVDKKFTIGLFSAGNIPAVGFHDLLCIWLTGQNALVRLSKDDEILLPALDSMLRMIDPGFDSSVHFIEGTASGFDAVIATGSNNTSRYYQFYFGSRPNIIRMNRHSLAVLTGEESKEDLAGLAHDICLYFGMGCRNVSKLYVPYGYDFRELLGVLSDSYGHLAEHQKFRNNYEYQKAILIINNIAFDDAGIMLLRESESLASPLAMLNYETYSDIGEVHLRLEQSGQDIQCIVSGYGQIPGSVGFGMAQKPHFHDFADGVDTVEFLLGLIN